MIRRTLLLFTLAALMGATVAGSQALAAPSESKLEVNENCVVAGWACWAAPGSSQPAAKVTIASGGAVTFVDHGKEANLAWSGAGAGAAPTCEASVPVAPVAPRTGWEGRCTFATPGAYRFESSTLWFEYTKYEVVVEGSTTTSPTGTTGEGGSNDGSSPGATTPNATPTGGSPTGSPLSGAPSIHSNQRGTTVRGSLQVSNAGAGDGLEVDLLATTASLAKTGSTTQVVGRFVSASVSAGRRSFAVQLDSRARRALKRRRRLALEVKITLTPAYGEATSITTSVTVHA